jgi:predicted amidohydrolase YtcJ
MEMADRYWGQRSALSYAWRSLLQSGATLAFGSDSPVEDLNPFLGLHAAVTRCRAALPLSPPSGGMKGGDSWYPEQRLTITEAVHAYTVGAAQAAGVADRLGSLSPGKLADLVVLDRDIFQVAPDEILDTCVVGTMIGGRWVHRLETLD